MKQILNITLYSVFRVSLYGTLLWRENVFPKLFHLTLQFLKSSSFSFSRYCKVLGKKVGSRFSYNINTLLESGNDLVNPFQPSVAFHIETSHLFYSEKQMTGFYIKLNTGLTWVNTCCTFKTSSRLLGKWYSAL